MRVPIEDLVNLLLDIEECKVAIETSATGLKAIQERLAAAMAKHGIPTTTVQDVAGTQEKQD